MGADSSNVSSMGVASTHSESSRSAESDDIILDEKSTVVGLLLYRMVVVGQSAAARGPTGYLRGLIQSSTFAGSEKSSSRGSLVL